MKAYVNTKSPKRLAPPVGQRNSWDYECYLSVEVEVRVAELEWQKQGLLYSATGYGARIPTRYMVKYMGRWRRVYLCQYSNSGTAYIGPAYDPCLTVDIEL